MRHLARPHLFIPISTCLFFSVVFALLGCDSSSQWEQENAVLCQKMMELERRQHKLQASIDSLWDATTAQLSNALPASFPPVDRDIFLKARNADHIRMFKSFELLDADAQSLVNKAGQQDGILANQARVLLEQWQAFERQKIQFLQKVEQQDAAASRRYANEFKSLTSESHQ